MAALAGETIIAGKVPGERIETTVRTANSANVTTTETIVDTVVAPVVTGRIYRITWDGEVASTVAGDDFQIAMRQDSAAGTMLQSITVDFPVVARGPRVQLLGEHTAVATADKTFVLTLLRVAGTGNIIAVATATAPTFLYVDYIRG